MSELDELKLTHWKQERADFARLLERLESGLLPKEQTASLRAQLAQIDALVASLEIRQSNSIH